MSRDRGCIHSLTALDDTDHLGHCSICSGTKDQTCGTSDSSIHTNLGEIDLLTTTCGHLDTLTDGAIGSTHHTRLDTSGDTCTGHRVEDQLTDASLGSLLPCELPEETHTQSAEAHQVGRIGDDTLSRPPRPFEREVSVVIGIHHEEEGFLLFLRCTLQGVGNLSHRHEVEVEVA